MHELDEHDWILDCDQLAVHLDRLRSVAHQVHDRVHTSVLLVVCLLVVLLILRAGPRERALLAILKVLIHKGAEVIAIHLYAVLVDAFDVCRWHYCEVLVRFDYLEVSHAHQSTFVEVVVQLKLLVNAAFHIDQVLFSEHVFRGGMSQVVLRHNFLRFFDERLRIVVSNNQELFEIAGDHFRDNEVLVPDCI